MARTPASARACRLVERSDGPPERRLRQRPADRRGDAAVAHRPCRSGLDALRVGVAGARRRRPAGAGQPGRPGRWAWSAAGRRLVAGAHDRAYARRAGPARPAQPARSSWTCRGRAASGPARSRSACTSGAVGARDGHVAVEAADVTEAHRLARVRRDFVANVSHELKTPVGALQLLAEALLEATETAGRRPRRPAAARRFAERIQHESARLGRLVRELLDLSRLQGAEPLPEPRAGRGRPGHGRGDRPHPHRRPRPRTSRSASAAPRPRRVRHREPAGHRGDQPGGERGRLLPEGTRVTVAARARGASCVEIAVTDQGIGIPPQRPGPDLRALLPGRPGPVREPPAAPASAWPSSSTSPPTTVARST